MNNKLRTNKAFTLIELVVAIGILAMVSSFAGVIFKVSIDSQRTGLANAEIMQKLRAITDQLDSDFQGFIKNAPAAATFHVTPTGIRYDRIAFFSNGDFQSTRQYDGKTVAGNVARIYYGQSAEPDPRTENPEDFKNVILVRRLQILTADPDPGLGDPDADDPNNPVEYAKRSLAEWKLLGPPEGAPGVSSWIGRPNAHLALGNIEEVMPMFLAKGVHNFKIQAVNDIDAGRIVWWPDNQQVIEVVPYGRGYPYAFKFTFTLYDSKGIIKDGRTFTHIVYLGD